jgi:hypothetical protein
MECAALLHARRDAGRGDICMRECTFEVLATRSTTVSASCIKTDIAWMWWWRGGGLKPCMMMQVNATRVRLTTHTLLRITQ